MSGIYNRSICNQHRFLSTIVTAYRASGIAVTPHHILCLIWTADAINNAAGFGFNGYDSDGVPRWDLISNLRIMNIEVSLFQLPEILYVNQRWMKSSMSCFLLFQFATSFKVFLDNWNIQTAHWLKRWEWLLDQGLQAHFTHFTYILTSLLYGTINVFH